MAVVTIALEGHLDNRIFTCRGIEIPIGILADFSLVARR